MELLVRVVANQRCVQKEVWRVVEERVWAGPVCGHVQHLDDWRRVHGAAVDLVAKATHPRVPWLLADLENVASWKSRHLVLTAKKGLGQRDTLPRVSPFECFVFSRELQTC